MLHRLTRTALIAALVAAALGRAELGADIEASVVFTPAFGVALLPAAGGAWFGAARFGSSRPVDLALAALSVLAAAVVALLVTGTVLGNRTALMAGITQPLALGSLAAAFALTQLLAWRQARPPSRRRN
jgi:enoyl-CoA hydratase/carnithine racemase